MSIITYSRIGDTGQLGNQLFEIATVLEVAKRCQARAVFPTRLVDLPIYRLFDLGSLVLEDHTWYDVIIFEYDNYEEISVPPSNGLVYDIRGYRQSLLYFNNIRTDLILLFTPRPEWIEVARRIGTDTVVHVRRGDNVKWYTGISICTPDYYSKALNTTEHVIACTDDPQYTRDVLGYKVPSTSIYIDFTLLWLARKVVVSASTFSWWAAYLGDHDEVVAPLPWWRTGVLSYLYGLNDPRHLGVPGWRYLDPGSGEPRTLKDTKGPYTPYLAKYFRALLS